MLGSALVYIYIYIYIYYFFALDNSSINVAALHLKTTEHSAIQSADKICIQHSQQRRLRSNKNDRHQTSEPKMGAT